MNKSLKIILWLCLMSVFFALAFFVFTNNENQRTQNAVHYLLNKKLGLNHYEISAFRMGESLVDVSGEWAIRLDTNEPILKLDTDIYQRADRHDLDYFNKIIMAKFHTVDSLNGFELFRGEDTLGENSFCENTKCNIYLLFKPNSRSLYLGIYKN